MDEVLLDLKGGQMSKLSRGMAVQVKPCMIGAGVPMKLGKDKLSKLMKAATGGKAMRLKMSDAELSGSGMMKKTVKKRIPKSVAMLETTVEPIVQTQRYFGTMVDRVLPAARPLIQLGNAQYGNLFIR